MLLKNEFIDIWWIIDHKFTLITLEKYKTHLATNCDAKHPAWIVNETYIPDNQPQSRQSLPLAAIVGALSW